MTGTIDRPDIESTYSAIKGYVRRTPLVHVDGADVGLPGVTLRLKLEALQVSGSFKARGAFSNLVTREVPPAGVAAASGGNHGAAVAYAAMRRGVRAKIFVPSVSSPTKIEKIRSYGADLTIVGERYNDTVGACERYCAQTGALNVHAFDQPETMRGTGTIGLEIEQQFPEVTTVLAGVGGGGLIGGIASWFATSAVRVIGVEPEGAPTMTRALEAGEPIDAPAGSIASDSLAPARIGKLVFPIARRDVDRVLLVSDDQIRTAQRALWNGCNVVAEPGGAAAFAAVLSGIYVAAGEERVCVVVSGGNTPSVSFS